MSIPDCDIDDSERTCERCREPSNRRICQDCRADLADLYVDERCEELRSKIGG